MTSRDGRTKTEMKKTPLKIGNLTFEYPFVLAPLAGITDRSMRSLCYQAGASLTYTEMVSAKGLWYGDRKTGELLRTGAPAGKSAPEGTGPTADGPAADGPVGFQLFGSEPEILRYAVRLLSSPSQAKAVDAEYAQRLAGEDLRAPLGARTVEGLTAPALFDLNAGCPVPKIVKNGEGSALLKDSDLFYDCVAAMVRGAREAATKTPIPVTVKIRKGFEKDDNCAVEIAKAAEAAGAAAVTVHGRTRQQFYDGRADWEAIAAVKAAVNIPVIGNGDVMSGEDALRMMEETGCDGVMIARGALGNPWIFRDAKALWDGEACPTPPSDGERIDLLLRHIEMVCEDKGEHAAVREMRKHVGWYIKGMRGATQVRRRINTAGTLEEMRQILTELR